MSVSRLLVCSGVLVLTVGVHLAGQQPARSGAAPQAAATARAAGGGGNVEHGRYLVERVAMCGECHSARDASGAIVEGTRYRGGAMPMRPSWAADWPTQIPRIAGFAGYTDAEARRVLMEGAIKRDGTQLRMPMPRFRMSAQDAADVIAFLRTI